MIDPKEVEAKLILSASEKGLLPVLQTTGITPESLAVFGEVLQFVYDYLGKYNKSPSEETIRLSFPDFPTYSTNNINIEYLADIVLNRAKTDRMRQILSETIDRLEQKPEEVIDFVTSKMAEIDRPSKTNIVIADFTSENWLENLFERRREIEEKGHIGLQTGIRRLDEEISLVPGDFVLIAGPPEVGKSLTLTRIVSEAYSVGKRILYISPEMTAEEVILRWHPIIARKYGYEFRYSDIISGNVDLDSYSKFARKIGERKDFIVVDSVEGGQLTVSKIEGLIRQYTPDVIGVDPVMLLTASDGTMAISWTSLLDVCYGLKFLATRTKTIIYGVTVVTADSFNSTEPADMEGLGLSKNIAYSVDLLISMALSHDNNTKNMKIIKKRKGIRNREKFPIVFEPEYGRIG